MDLLGLDTETTGSDLRHGCKPFYVSTCTADGRVVCWQWDVNPKTREPIIPQQDKDEIRDTIRGKRVVIHNSKFDILALEAIGINVWDLAGEVEDTLPMSHALESAASHKLKDLCLQHLDITDDDQQALRDATNEARRIGRKLGWRIASESDPHFPAQKRAPKEGWWVLDTWLPRAVAKAQRYPKSHPWWNVLDVYGSLDAVRVIGLYQHLYRWLKEEGLYPQYKWRKKLLPVFYRMESHGTTISQTRWKAAKNNFATLAATAERKAFKLAGNKIDNLRSSKQLQGLLYGTWKLPATKATKEGYSTDADTLQGLLDILDKDSKPYLFIKNLVASRKCGKMGDYLEEYHAYGIRIDSNQDWLKLYSTTNLTGTATTRVSKQNPNDQNVSKKEEYNLREIFGPMPGREWYSIDYNNIEMRIFAYESGDKRLIRAFESGQSVHMIIAQELWPEEVKRLGEEAFKETDLYRWVKNGNFALIYGASPRKADATYHRKGAYERIRKGLPLIDKFMQQKFSEGRRNGYVTTLGGYRLQVPHDKPHVAVNYFVQGSAGVIIQQAMPKVDAYLQSIGPEYKLIMMIHDELDFDFPRKKANTSHIKHICHLMASSGNRFGIPTPVEAKRIRESWAHGEKLAI
jgi:DNA polymerase I-like protein with 3'-5' exonuclease and polymerase domains